MSNGSWLAYLKFIAIAGVGEFADGYLNITIGLVVPMLGYLYFADNGNSIPAVTQDIMKGTLSIGMIIGQLAFGVFGDAWGRHKVYGKELIITMLGTLLLIVAPTNLSHNGIEAWVAVWRLVTGVGIGADYPMTSALSAEQTQFGSRAELVLTVFACGSIGSIAAAIVYIVLLVAFKSAIISNVFYLQWVWRLLFGIGLIPAAVTVYARLRIRETKPWQEFVEGEKIIKRTLQDQIRDFRVYFANWRQARASFTICFTWFLFDIAFYGVNLNQSLVLSDIGYGAGNSTWQTFWNTAVGNIIVYACGYAPGFYVGIFLPDRIGRVRQQFLGCAIVAILYAIWAGVSDSTSKGGLLTLFTLSQFFLNAGPACSTFLIPADIFPTRVRGTAHGIAAASGKAGAVLTAFAFASAKEAMGLRGVLGLFSGVMALCAVVTLWIPEAKGLSVEDIERDVLYGGSVGSDVEAPVESLSEGDIRKANKAYQ